MSKFANICKSCYDSEAVTEYESLGGEIIPVCKKCSEYLEEEKAKILVLKRKKVK